MNVGGELPNSGMPAEERDRALLQVSPFAGDLEHTPVPEAGTACLYWLGQAGFLVKLGGLTIVIDAYLSNSLEAKYAHTETPHPRMMPPPVSPGKLVGVDVVLCSHRHTDHMDPGSLVPILSASPTAVLVAPRAARARLTEIGVPEDRVVLVNAGDTLALSDSVTLKVIASAHETLEIDENGDHPYLGFVIRSGDLTLYHSGDCVPFEKLAAAVRALHVDLALLPINGRNRDLTRRGIAGNFFSQEAAALCQQAGIGNLIFHHFGMFAFNSADPDQARAEILKQAPGLNAVAAALATEFRIAPQTADRRKK